MSRKLTNREVEDTCKYYGLEWIEGEYIEAKKPIICKDKNGYIIPILLSNLKFWNGSTSPFHTSNPYTIQNIKTLILNNKLNLELLTTEYKGNNKPLLCKCTVCSHEWKTTLSHLQSKSKCPKCAGVLKLTIDIVKERVNKLNPNIIILDKSYNNTNTKLHCKCKICNHEWNPICNNLLAGRGCPKCGIYITNCDGLYNETIAERNKNKWLKENANVYIIECFNSEEHFYKIGITKKDIKKRFSGNIPYEYTLIYLLKTNKYDGTYIEKILHNIHKDYKYIPRLKFDGYSECFSKINKIDILNIKKSLESKNEK